MNINRIAMMINEDVNDNNGIMRPDDVKSTLLSLKEYVSREDMPKLRAIIENLDSGRLSKAYELLDEGWGGWLRNAALAGGLALGGLMGSGQAHAAPSSHDATSPEIAVSHRDTGEKSQMPRLREVMSAPQDQTTMNRLERNISSPRNLARLSGQLAGMSTEQLNQYLHKLVDEYKKETAAIGKSDSGVIKRINDVAQELHNRGENVSLPIVAPPGRDLDDLHPVG